MSRLARFAWAVLGYNLGVVLWGAFVRASGSGAGCGSHWPLCNGEVVPPSPAVATLIELTHRVTSGFALVLVVVLALWSRRTAPPGHPVRLGAALSLIFILTEAAIGAGIVLLEKVGQDSSLARAGWLAGHLLNTFVLLACLALTAWWASGGPAIRIRGLARPAWLVGTALIAVLLVGLTGAVTALGDTLFPAASLAEAFRQDLSPTAHILLRMRVAHPVLAVSVGLLLLTMVPLLAACVPRDTAMPGPSTATLAMAIAALVLLQLMVGAANVLLLAPVWLQLVHLLLADLLWITLVLLGARALSGRRSQREALPAELGRDFLVAGVGR